MLNIRVADPHYFNADPDPDPAFHLKADPDPDPAVHLNADPDPAFRVGKLRSWAVEPQRLFSKPPDLHCERLRHSMALF
jgi:hypothetical protein